MKLLLSSVLLATTCHAFRSNSFSPRPAFTTLGYNLVKELDLQDIKAELRDRGISYHDCLDKESLLCRLLEARNNRITVSEKADDISEVKVPSVDKEERLNELRSKELKDLKLMCSRRSIRYAPFKEKEDFIQAIWRDMKQILSYSVSEALRPGKATDLTADQLDQELTSTETPILVDIYATWCGPCKIIEPQVNKLAAELNERVRVVKLDADKFPDWAGKHQVQGLPVILIIQNGKVQDRVEGTVTKDVLIEMLQPYLQQ